MDFLTSVLPDQVTHTVLKIDLTISEALELTYFDHPPHTHTHTIHTSHTYTHHTYTHHTHTTHTPHTYICCTLVKEEFIFYPLSSVMNPPKIPSYLNFYIPLLGFFESPLT